MVRRQQIKKNRQEFEACYTVIYTERAILVQLGKGIPVHITIVIEC